MTSDHDAGRCPTCGRPGYEPAITVIASAEDLVAAMRQPGGNGRPKDVYRAGNGSGYYLTYTRDVKVRKQAIEDALRRGWIKLIFPNARDYWALPAQAAEYHREYQEMEDRGRLRSKARARP